ncbi:MAG: cytochrome c [Vicinamibacterales bacterium]
MLAWHPALGVRARRDTLVRIVAVIVALVAGCTICQAAPSQAAASQATGTAPGADLYRTACAACHGIDGRGVAVALVGFDTPLPNFTDCSFSTVEPDGDWMAVAHDGGPARGFDRRMPAFGDAMTDAELQQALDHTRRFCRDPAWPRGELNVPRALVTEKAFPENESVLTTTINATGTGLVGNEFLYEQRLGSRTQYEVVVPVQVQEGPGGGWERGLGDVAFALKRVLMHSLDRGHILSAAGEIILPTGKDTAGLGGGVTVFEPFVAFGQLLPADSFVQAQAGLELPFETASAGREAFWRVAAGRSFSQGRFGRSWSPMVELLAARDLEDDATTHWDLVPQMQVTLNKRQHIMINAGVRFPLNERAGRRTQVITYFLWDWFDGGLLDGWR